MRRGKDGNFNYISKNKIPVYWRIKLEQKDDVIYFPFRILKAVNLGQADKKILQESKALAITSLFGAQVFVII
ncbi:hypothetical protein SAZ89_09945 [Limosilactobacillus reuteri]|nr:hypothetical protein [Limosilactobacillus reuteri]